jgi:hypothetical protein
VIAGSKVILTAGVNKILVDPDGLAPAVPLGHLHEVISYISGIHSGKGSLKSGGMLGNSQARRLCFIPSDLKSGGRTLDRIPIRHREDYP